MSKKEEKKSNLKLKNKIEGQAALDALVQAMNEDGILVASEQVSEEELSARVEKLEQEMETLKDLMARALKSSNSNVLND